MSLCSGLCQWFRDDGGTEGQAHAEVVMQRKLAPRYARRQQRARGGGSTRRSSCRCALARTDCRHRDSRAFLRPSSGRPDVRPRRVRRRQLGRWLQPFGMASSSCPPATRCHSWRMALSGVMRMTVRCCSSSKPTIESGSGGSLSLSLPKTWAVTCARSGSSLMGSALP